MLYFHNTFKEIQKLATYAAISFQLLGGFAPDALTRGSDQGLCPFPLGAPTDPRLLLQCLLFHPKPKVSG